MSKHGRRKVQGDGWPGVVVGWWSGRDRERRRRASAVVSGFDRLEPRTMLTAVPVSLLTPNILAPQSPGTAWNLQLDPGAAGSQALAAIEPVVAAAGASIGTTPVSGLYVVQGTPAAMGALGPQLAAISGVSYAGPEHLFQATTLPAGTPNDPNYQNGDQWQLNGTWGINAPGAWSVTVGSTSVIVADADTGLNSTLADIQANTMPGWNTITNTSNTADGNGHGTFTAGEIGAVGNNGIGVTGAEWTTRIMPVAFLDSSGSGTDTAAAAAIEYAIQNGAKVINASWGGQGIDPTIQTALQDANNAGVIVVCAAGNNGTSDDTTFFSPGSYSAQDPNVITVAATDNQGQLASWSNFGTQTVQLAAPGVNIFSLTSNGTDGSMRGTSMAAPLVTATVALVESAHPTWTMSQVISAVLDHTTPDPALVGKVATGGLVNAAAAVNNTVGPRVVSASTVGSVVGAGGLTGFTVTFSEEVVPSTFSASSVTVTGPNGPISGVTVQPVAGSNDHQFTLAFPSQATPGDYTVNISPTGILDLYGNTMAQTGTGATASGGYTTTSVQVPTAVVTALPSTVAPGATEPMMVTIEAPGGGAATSFTGTLQFRSSDPSASLASSYTYTTADAGVHVFPVVLNTPGAQTITITDPAWGISTTLTIDVGTPSANSATFVKLDTTTQGSWSGVYGSTGYDVIGGQTSLPSYATITASGEQTQTWSTSTTDPRAPQTAPAATTRVAEAWYGSSFTVNVNLTDGQVHDLALYFLDWTSSGRTEVVQITDAATGTVLDTQTITSFDQGTYLIDEVSGDINIKITAQAGPDAVLSGLFLDPQLSAPPVPTPTPSPSATFLGTDTTTQGTWNGVYGSQGYVVVGGQTSLPSYASVTPSGIQNWTWTTSTTDVRAPQSSANATSRVAECWYNSSFTVNVNLTDGQTHDLELYFLDWVKPMRTQLIQISDASTGATLASATVTSFYNGAYLDFQVSGNINVTITDQAGPNAVISALFLDPKGTGVAGLGGAASTQTAPASTSTTDLLLGALSWWAIDTTGGRSSGGRRTA